GGVYGRALAPGPEPRIDAHDGALPVRRREQEVLQVLREDLHGFAIGRELELHPHVRLDARTEEAAERVAARSRELAGEGRGRDVPARPEDVLDGLVLVDADLRSEHALG